jgi:phosphoribosylformylglycinamidine (FGAM) synthase-like enzyme
MSAYEMMLSESQERMLMVLDPEKHAEAEASSSNGALISRLSAKRPTRCALKCSTRATRVADLPIKELGDEAPEYDRPWVPPTPPARCRQQLRRRCADGLMTLLAAPMDRQSAGSMSNMTRWCAARRWQRPAAMPVSFR